MDRTVGNRGHPAGVPFTRQWQGRNKGQEDKTGKCRDSSMPSYSCLPLLLPVRTGKVALVLNHAAILDEGDVPRNPPRCDLAL